MVNEDPLQWEAVINSFNSPHRIPVLECKMTPLLNLYLCPASQLVGRVLSVAKTPEPAKLLLGAHVP